MKYIFKRNTFLNEEAKLRDVLLEPTKKRIARVWGDEYLDLEEIEATKKINQGKWKLSDEDKGRVINRFFDFDYNWVKDKLDNLPDKFAEVIKECVETESNELNRDQKERVEKALVGKELDMKTPKVKQLSCLYYPIFKLLNVNETKADEMILRETPGGRPVMDEVTKKPKKVKKEKGALVFSGNLGNINSFVSSYNRAFPDDKVDESIFTNRNIQNISNMINDNPAIIEFDLFGGGDMFLLLEHKPQFIMNMSVSKFYKSCQELYFGGGHGTGYMEALLSNVFDPNSVPAFLVFDTPYYIDPERKGGSDLQKVSDVMPLCRLVVRNVEPFGSDESKGLRFDQTYPDRMTNMLREMIEKYSGNKHTDGLHDYFFAPDIDPKDFSGLKQPYMDSMGLKSGFTIGKNFKSLHLGRHYDWNTLKIANDNKIKEVVVETTDLPENFFKIPLDIEWIKFKYLNIKDLSKFDNIVTDAISLDKCKVGFDFFEDLHEISPELSKLALTSINLSSVDTIDFSTFDKLKEIELLYTLDEESLLSNINLPENLNKLTISGDMLKLEENKEYLKELKNKGVTVVTKGIVL